MDSEIRYIQKASVLTLIYINTYVEWICSTPRGEFLNGIMKKSNPKWLEMTHIWIINEIQRTYYDLYPERKTEKNMWIFTKNILIDIFNDNSNPYTVKKKLNKVFGKGVICALTDFLPYYPEWLYVRLPHETILQ